MSGKTTRPVIWDWPLRLWHWAFAACIAFSLYSGLDGDIGLLAWHQRCGLVLLGLIVFRLGWAIWGGRHARLRNYWTTPRAFVEHFRGGAGASAHTAPGIVLAIAMLFFATLQTGSGLFATDDIFNEGPLNRYVSDAFADGATWLHHRLHWAIIALVGIHLVAHAIYGFVLRDRLALSMFTGRKQTAAPSTPHFLLRAVLTVALAAGVALAVTYARKFFD